MSDPFLNTSIIGTFVSGALALGLWLGGLFFFHGYRQTKDRFFIFLAFSFWVMMLDRVVWGLCGKPWFIEPQIDLRTLVYTIRFVGFSIIAFGIVDKNTRFEKSGKDKERPPLTLVSSERKRA